MKYNQKILDLIKEISTERKTQDTFGTNTPIYIVQRRMEEVANIEHDCVDIQRLSIPKISSDDDFYPTLEDIKNGDLRHTPLPCELVLELEKANTMEEIEELFKEYFATDDQYYNVEIINLQFVWKNMAYFLLLKDAKEYQKYQKHNLGISRVYADYIGYANRGALSTLLRLLDEEEFVLSNDE